MQAMTGTRHEWQTPDGESFPYSLWATNLPAGERPRAIVIAVHGLSGAALDFEPLGRLLIKHRIITYAPELRGQGHDPRSERRGDLERIEDWFADLRAFFSLVRSRHPDAQIYYYGESMGAALLVRFLAQAREIDLPAGLILSSPVVAVPSATSFWHRMLFHFFLRVRPLHRINLRQAAKRDHNDPAKWVTRDEAHRVWFQTAPHKLDSFTVRFFKRLFELLGGCDEAATKIRTPVLVLYAANDVFIPPARVEQFFARLGSREKELRFFPQSYHLLLHDFDQAEVLERIEGWLLRRIEVTDQRLTSDARFQI
jgi:alpha-beta hydrolase superfamily lysophospholipase